MSLILEALRKSEAQRRLGQAPDLHSPVIATTSRGRLPRWLVPALALMLVGAAAWWLGRMAVPDPSNGTATEAVVSPTPLPVELDTTERPTADAPESPPLPLPVQSPPARPSPATAAAPRPAPEPALPAAPRAPAAAARESAPPPAAEVQRRPAVAATPTPDPAPAEAAEVPAPSTPLAPAAAEAGDGLLRLADLPAATRAGLPPLRISMHVYSEQPARRFAIIDGRRVGEGGLLEGQGVVEAIRRDGIVVDFDGRRVLLPRP